MWAVFNSIFGDVFINDNKYKMLCQNMNGSNCDNVKEFNTEK